MIPLSQDNILILIFSSYKRSGLGCPDFLFIYTIIYLQLFVNFCSTVGSGRAEKRLIVIPGFPRAQNRARYRWGGCLGFSPHKQASISAIHLSSEGPTDASLSSRLVLQADEGA